MWIKLSGGSLVNLDYITQIEYIKLGNEFKLQYLRYAEEIYYEIFSSEPEVKDRMLEIETMLVNLNVNCDHVFEPKNNSYDAVCSKCGYEG